MDHSLNAAGAQLADGFRNALRVGEVLGCDLDEAEVLSAVEKERDLGAPAGADTEG